jgi:hypothetical protein
MPQVMVPAEAGKRCSFDQKQGEQSFVKRDSMRWLQILPQSGSAWRDRDPKNFPAPAIGYAKKIRL